jgi:cytochrome P450 family 28
MYLSRYCNESIEVELPKDKKLFIEQGTILLFPIHSFLKDSEYFPDPEKFDPDRFSPENGGVKAFIDRGVFMPFGTGPRICPGNRFAVTQSKLAIAELIRNFEVTVNPKTPEKFEIHPQAIIITLEGACLNLKEIQRK